MEYAPRSAVNQSRLFALLSGFCWSLAGVFIKSLALHPAVIAFYRSLFAMLFFLPFAGTRRWRARPRLLFSGLAFTAATGSLVWATKLTTAANAIVLQNTAPVFVCVLVYLLFRERPTRPNLVTLLFGMAGILAIFAGAAGAQDFLGVSVGLGSGFALGIYFVNLRFLRGFDPFGLMLANNFVSTLVLFGFAHGRLSVSASELIALACLGVVQFAFAHYFFFRSIEHISVQEASLISLTEPVLNPLWVALWVGEVPSLTTFIGGGLILSGLALRYITPDQVLRARRTAS